MLTIKKPLETIKGANIRKKSCYNCLRKVRDSYVVSGTRENPPPLRQLYRAFICDLCENVVPVGLVKVLPE